MSKGLDVDKALVKSDKKERERWSQTKRIGDTTEEITVEKLDNQGYLVVISKSWYDAKKNWQNKESKLYSPTNPLDKNEDDKPIDALFDTLGNKKVK